jgi:sec-independent protein translocase protein TatA
MGLDNPLHIAFLLLLLLLVFGAKRLPEMGRSLGEGLRGFKSSLNGESAPTIPIAAPPSIAAPSVAAVQVAAPSMAPLVAAPLSAAAQVAVPAPLPQEELTGS